MRNGFINLGTEKSSANRKIIFDGAVTSIGTCSNIWRSDKIPDAANCAYPIRTLTCVSFCSGV